MLFTNLDKSTTRGQDKIMPIAEKVKKRDDSAMSSQTNLELIQYLENKFKEVRQEVKEVRQEVKEVRQEVKEVQKNLSDKIDYLQEKYFKFMARWTFIFGSTIIGLLVKIAFFN